VKQLIVEYLSQALGLVVVLSNRDNYIQLLLGNIFMKDTMAMKYLRIALMLIMLLISLIC
jgi:hypothetical protein